MKIEKTVFDGLNGYELTTENWKLTVIADCGPRIAYLGRPDGKNILYWDKDGVIRGEWRLRGGHRLWLTRPMADESEDTYFSDNASCEVELLEDGLRVTAPAHPIHKLERGMEIRCAGDGRFAVRHTIKNVGDLIYSGGIWSPTCINPTGKEIRIPLGQDDVTWDIVKVVIPRVFAGNTTQLEDPQVYFEGNDMVVRPAGRVTKRCVSAPKGTITMTWPEERIAFTKRVPYQPMARYPLDGCNLAVFVGQDNWMGELESYGAEQPIIPGQTIEHTEYWQLETLTDKA